MQPIRISNDDIDFYDTDKHLEVCRLSKSGTISSTQHKRTKFTKIKMTVCKSDTTLTQPRKLEHQGAEILSCLVRVHKETDK